MSMGDKNNTVLTREQVVRVFPNLAVTHEDTEFQAYREYKPMKNMVELTMYVMEPGMKKLRIDAEVWEESFDSAGVELMPHNVRIIHWGSAHSVFNCYEGDRT